jgi:cell fate (sporulation/competence/biofilm development) regulator YlbF (YheA/YmcA/DUF963 family)
MSHLYRETVKRFKSKINTNSDEFQANYQAMQALVDELNEKLAESLYEGKKEHIDRYVKAGRLLGS